MEYNREYSLRLFRASGLVYSSPHIRIMFFLDIFGTDLTTRSGLRKVHANFNSIYSKLHRTYEHSESYYKVKGGIVGIAARMCVDSLLRNKLFDKGRAPCGFFFPIPFLDFTTVSKASWTRSCRCYT